MAPRHAYNTTGLERELSYSLKTPGELEWMPIWSCRNYTRWILDEANTHTHRHITKKVELTGIPQTVFCQSNVCMKCARSFWNTVLSEKPNSMKLETLPWIFSSILQYHEQTTLLILVRSDAFQQDRNLHFISYTCALSIWCRMYNKNNTKESVLLWKPNASH